MNFEILALTLLVVCVIGVVGLGVEMYKKNKTNNLMGPNMLATYRQSRIDSMVREEKYRRLRAKYNVAIRSGNLDGLFGTAQDLSFSDSSVDKREGNVIFVDFKNKSRKNRAS